MRGEVGKAAGLAPRPELEDGEHAQRDEGGDGDHLDEREPEFELAVIAHLQKVDDDEQPRHECGEGVDADRRKPVVQDHARDIGLPRHEQRPEPPVQPADGEARPAANGLLCVGGERAGVGRRRGHFSEHAHDEDDEHAARQIGQHRGRSGLGDDAARAHEQRRADHAGNRHHGEMAGLERAAQCVVARGFGRASAGVCVHVNASLVVVDLEPVFDGS